MTRAEKPAVASVIRDDSVVGRLLRTSQGAVFEYDPSFLAAGHAPWDGGISYRLPREVPRVETRGTNLHPFFAGLLPEGIRLEALIRRVKTSKDDLLSLLVDAGADCIGDISVVVDADHPPSVAPAIDTLSLSSASFSEILSASLSGKRGLEPTLPGVQDKVSAAMISLPLRAKGGAAYILKLNPPKMPRLVENEHFFLEIARTAGLSVARAELVHDREGAAGLLVERFDRISPRKGVVKKVHQEDACQFLDRYPGDKYVLSYADLARGIGELGSAPIVETAKYLRLIAFSYLIANGDLHAKNVSLRTDPADGRVELTPAYDVLTSLPYGDRTMALSFDGRNDNLKRAGFISFGERFGVRRAATEAILDELCDATSASVVRLGEIGLEARKTADLARTIKKRCVDLGTKQEA
ncbi:MAG: HipA domain-containing protein [Labilithrix sp.]|nr:HipA domain-containing protein [Labilithrix sp.]MCW5817166.1 HipA domain-containing protein [Labilithrix sp.]